MRNKKGFTLIEVMVSLLIVGVLMLVAMPAVEKAKINSNQASAKTTLKTIVKALESYYNVKYRYPNDIDLLVTSNPSFINKNYFVDSHFGYTFTSTNSNFYYEIVATPLNNNHGAIIYKATTGGNIVEM